MPESKIYGYINGKILPVDKINISPYDIGLLRGFGVYEGLTTRNGRPFYLKEHFRRFQKSAKSLGLRVPVTETEISKIINTLTLKNGFNRTNFRILLTGGEAIGGIRFNPEKPTLLILAEPWTPLPSVLYEKGGSLITERHTRFMPEIKTTNYITAVKLQQKRTRAGAIEILFITGDKVFECSTSNIFMFKKNKLITVKRKVLDGITRLATIALAKKHFKVEERDIKIPELLKADEVFITSTYKDILPIVKIDKKKIGTGLVGDNTKVLMQAFSN